MTLPTTAPSPVPLASFCLQVDGMTCDHCRQRVEAVAGKVDGVSSARVDLAAGTLTVQGGQAGAVTGAATEAVIAAVSAAGYPARLCGPGGGQIQSGPLPILGQTATTAVIPLGQYRLQVADMHCASCVRRVEQAILAVAGVRAAEVNLIEQSAGVEGGDPTAVAAAITKAGYAATLVAENPPAGDDGYEIDLLGLHCASCVTRVEQAIAGVAGVQTASVHLVEQRALVRGGDPTEVVAAILAQGYGAALRARSMAANTFFVKVLPLPSPADLEQILEVLQARDAATEVVAEAGRLRLSTGQHPADVLLRLADIGYQGVLEEAYADPSLHQAEETRREIRRSWQRAILAGLVGFGVMAGHMSGLFPHLHQGRGFWAGIALLCLFTMVFSGRSYYLNAWKQARHRTATMDTLVALGTGAAWISSLLVIAAPEFIPGGGNHLYLDASVMILAFLQLGHVLETRAKRTTSEAIGALVGLRAKTAWVLRSAGQVEVPVSLLRVGDPVRVRPGEKVPIDGVIIQGRTTIDESMLTGEPVAVVREVGDPVTGGTINRSGVFVLTVTRLGEETTLARIIRLVKAAQLSKPPIGRLVDRIAAVFVPVVLVIALITFAGWLLLGPEPRLAFALTAAIAVLVIACPCALGLATPIAIMVGTSRAAAENVLIRNSDALQTASTLTHVVVDKTGTLTEGRPAVTAIFPAAGGSEAEVLLWAASLESGSEHPLAAAVLAAQQQDGRPLPVLEDFTAIPGRGVRAQQGKVRYLLGNDHFFAEQGLVLPGELAAEAAQQAAQGGTPVWLGRDLEVLGLLILKDPVRRDSAAAIAALQRLGIEVVMCTGDNRATALAVAREVGIGTVHSEILPEEKLAVIAALQQQGHKVGMVGDGVNDAPALAQADTGFALGSGTDVAIENADITLTGDSLQLVAIAIAISSATIANIKQNLFGAFFYNVIGIPLAAGLFYPLTGWMLDPVFASAAMALSSVTVVTNANRLRYFRLG